MIHWCELCNNAPSDGVLEIIRTGSTEIDYAQACTPCVEGIKDEDWL